MHLVDDYPARVSQPPQPARPAFLDRNGAHAVQEYRREALAGFLQSRRARVAPDPAWPVVDPRTPRRVPGMRREELAWAAGVSVDYYTKLEQARAMHPSSAVVESIASVLGLGELDRRYLLALASLSPVSDPGEKPAVTAAAEETLRRIGDQMRSAVMLHLLSSDLMIRSLDRSTAAVLYPDPGSRPPEGTDVSLLAYIFAEPLSRQVYLDWWDKAREVVGLAHLSLATTIPSARLLATVAELWETSAPFRDLWARFDPYEKGEGMWRLHLGAEGAGLCRFATVQTPACRDISLVVYHRVEGG